MDYHKICRVETLFYPLVVDGMEADLNVNLRVIVRNGWDLSRLNDWKSPAYVTRMKPVVSPEDRFMTF